MAYLKVNQVAKRSFRYHLEGYEAVGGTSRRYKNKATGETIARRQFVKLAKKVQIIPQEHKTAREQRLTWYTNYANRQVWLEGGLPYDYVSQADMSKSPEFNYYDRLVHSPYEEDRDVAREYWDEMEDIYANQDWGETP